MVQAPKKRTENIIVYSSDKTAVNDVVAALQQCYEVHISTDMKAFESQFQTIHPDLILISGNDVTSGKDVCCRVRQQEGQRHTGIIFMGSSESQQSDALSVECLEMGADDFLKPECSQEELLARVKAVLRLKAMTDELRSANHRLRVLSLTDELTGLANMRHFNQKYSDLLRACRYKKTSLAVIMIDLDHFKSVNDTANHLVGSFVISEVGKIISRCDLIGEADISARYGGDEFIIAINAANVSKARKVCEKLRRAIARHVFAYQGVSLHITASIGFCWVDKGFVGKAEDVIKAADLMLYESKARGRDRVVGTFLQGDEPGLSVTEEAVPLNDNEEDLFTEFSEAS